jgi:hypothetical protein
MTDTLRLLFLGHFLPAFVTAVSLPMIFLALPATKDEDSKQSPTETPNVSSFYRYPQSRSLRVSVLFLYFSLITHFVFSSSASRSCMRIQRSLREIRWPVTLFTLDKRNPQRNMQNSNKRRPNLDQIGPESRDRKCPYRERHNQHWRQP